MFFIVPFIYFTVEHAGIIYYHMVCGKVGHYLYEMCGINKTYRSEVDKHVYSPGICSNLPGVSLSATCLQPEVDFAFVQRFLKSVEILCEVIRWIDNLEWSSCYLCTFFPKP